MAAVLDAAVHGGPGPQATTARFAFHEVFGVRGVPDCRGVSNVRPPPAPRMSRPKPVRVRRLAAATLDAALAAVLALAPAAISPVQKARLFGVGLLLAAAYVLLRDGVPYAEWGARSLAKRWLGIRPYRLSGEAMDLATSVRRNVTLGGAVGAVGLVYVLGGFRGIAVAGISISDLVTFAALAVVAVEALLVAVDPVGRRIGDRLARTRVIEARA